MGYDNKQREGIEWQVFLVVNDIPGTGQVAGLTNLAVLNAAGYEVTSYLQFT